MSEYNSLRRVLLRDASGGVLPLHAEAAGEQGGEEEEEVTQVHVTGDGGVTETIGICWSLQATDTVSPFVWGCVLRRTTTTTTTRSTNQKRNLF